VAARLHKLSIVIEMVILIKYPFNALLV
jgi:hypothetical protein